MAKTIYPRDERKTQFVNTGIKLAKKNGLSGVTISAVAKEHKVTAPLIFHIFGTRAGFHTAVKAAAKKQKISLESVKKPAAVKTAKKPAAVKAAKKPKAKKPVAFPQMPAPTTSVV